MPNTTNAKQRLFNEVYHLVYHQAERSGIHLDDASQSKPIFKLELLKKSAQMQFPHTLMGMHTFLRQHNHNISHADFVKVVRDDFFTHGHKSMFLALVGAEFAGELNMFVIRKIAVKKGKQNELIEAISKQYNGHVLAVKPIPPLARFFKGRHMRGNKWRRGGRPHIAMIVFDTEPLPASAEDRQRHTFVLNSRQFFKPELRDWFASETGAPLKLNPLHSTDNEAEALAHLHLFFTPHEQTEILAKAAEIRKTLTTAKVSTA